VRVSGRAAVLLALATQFACSTPEQPPLRVASRTLDLPAPSRTHATRSVDEIFAGIAALYPNIGSWPPRFEDEGHRDRIYAAWSDLLADALACDWGPHGEEQRLFALAELYRMGHNFDVAGSADEADAHLRECLARFPRSVPCNLSSAWFFLSVQPTPGSLARAQRSLETLRDVHEPAKDEEVEAGWVFLHFYRRDPEATRRQIDRYLTEFPDGPRAAMFRKMRDGLGEEIPLREW
jgi:hypothetical protein